MAAIIAFTSGDLEKSNWKQADLHRKKYQLSSLSSDWVIGFVFV